MEKIPQFPQETLQRFQDLCRLVAERAAKHWHRTDKGPPSAEEVFVTLSANQPFAGQPIKLSALRARVARVTNPQDSEAVLKVLVRTYGWQHVDFWDDDRPGQDNGTETATARPTAA